MSLFYFTASHRRMHGNAVFTLMSQSLIMLQLMPEFSSLLSKELVCIQSKYKTSTSFPCKDEWSSFTGLAHFLSSRGFLLWTRNVVSPYIWVYRQHLEMSIVNYSLIPFEVHLQLVHSIQLFCTRKHSILLHVDEVSLRELIP